MSINKIFLAAFIWSYTLNVSAQNDHNKDSNLNINGYVDLYYGFDFNRPVNNTRAEFVYSNNRHNEVNLNIGFIKAGYDNGSIRSNLALMSGTYTNANLAAEQGVLKNVLEANAGIKLSKKSNFWLDAGIFASHIGFESIISKDCWVLTRGIASDNTPYYESGAKLTYATKDGKLTLVGLYLNGWQRITREYGNSKPAGGLQVYYKPNDKITFNYSNYLGVQGINSEGLCRFYHNFYGILHLNSSLGMILGFDYGIQEQTKGSSDYNHILSPVIIMRYALSNQWALAGRFESYQDRGGIIVPKPTSNGFNVTAYSLNIDYAPTSNALIRLEGKRYDSNDNIFDNQGQLNSNDILITTNLAISF